MNSSEFEKGRPNTGEVDWTSQLPEFSVRDRDVLRFMGYETVFLTGEYFNDLISEHDVHKITEEFKTHNFDFANMRTMQSEVAVLRSFFLPGSEKLSNEASHNMIQEYTLNLREKKSLRDVRLRIGGVADYAAIFQWFAEQQIWAPATSNYIATSTNNTINGGRRSLAIMFNGLAFDTDYDIAYPKYFLKGMPLYNPSYGARIAPIVVPV